MYCLDGTDGIVVITATQLTQTGEEGAETFKRKTSCKLLLKGEMNITL